jgi:hypothetical protein
LLELPADTVAAGDRLLACEDEDEEGEGDGEAVDVTEAED